MSEGKGSVAVVKAVVVSILFALGAALLTAGHPRPAVSSMVPEPGVLVGFGLNDSGEIGNDLKGVVQPLPVQVVGVGGSGMLADVVDVSAGGRFTLALRDDGAVFAWGANGLGQLGNGDAPNDADHPTQVVGPEGVGFLSDIVALDAGSDHALAVREDGAVFAWGNNSQGQLGVGNTGGNSDVPVQVKGVGGAGSLSGIVDVGAGYYHSLARGGDGSVYAWGPDASLELGNGPGVSPSNTPVRVHGLGDAGFLAGVVEADAGAFFNIARLADGSVVAWGSGFGGTLGDGKSPTGSGVPVRVKGVGGAGILASIVGVSAGNGHSVALLADGSVVSWGQNAAGQLGDDGGGTNRDVPVRVVGPGVSPLLAGIVSVHAGYEHSLAVTADGGVFAWGNGFSGQLGDGNTGVTRDRPVPVKDLDGSGPLTGAVSAAAGYHHSMVLAHTARASIAGPAYARTQAVAISMSGSGIFPIDGYYVSENPAAPIASSPAWGDSPPVSHVLSPGEGKKTLYAFTRDTQDNVSPAAEATVTLDTIVPGAKLSLPPFSRALRTRVSLGGIDASGVLKWLLSTTAATPNPLDPRWKSFRPKTVPLVAGPDGERTVFGFVMDRAGNISAAASDTLRLDRRAPVLGIASPKKDARLARLGRIEGTAEDLEPGSGLARALFAIRQKAGTQCSWWNPKAGKLVPAPCNAPRWFPLRPRENWSRGIGALDDAGRYRLFLRFFDRAKNLRQVTRDFEILP
jgi:alpha-tubulin suppressor-like RCC1 family protein